MNKDIIMVSEPTSPSTVWFEDEPDGSWWACDIPGTDEGGEWTPVHEA